MELLLTGTRDQALLALVAFEAKDAARESGGYLGRTALQKILYSLKTVGVPMSYRFDLHHYGPYCDEISRDVDWLLADRVLIDRSDNKEKFSNYAPGEAGETLLALHAEYVRRYRKEVRTMVKTFVPLRPERLELLTTLDYLYRQKRASGGNGPRKQWVVDRFLQLKRDRFKKEEVERAYDAMAAAGLVAG